MQLQLDTILESLPKKFSPVLNKVLSPDYFDADDLKELEIEMLKKKHEL